MRGQTVLILGGGVGGVVAANALRRRLHRRHRVVLVDREPSFALAASFLWIMNGTRVPEQISRPLARLTRKGIEVIRGEVERIDPARKQAMVGGRTIEADHLVVALGAEFTPQAIPGLVEWGPHLLHPGRRHAPARRAGGLRFGTGAAAHGRAGLQVPGRSLRGGDADRRDVPEAPRTAAGYGDAGGGR